MKDNPALIDTNVLVYAYGSVAGSKHLKAKKLVKKVWEEGAIVSLQNLCEFFECNGVGLESGILSIFMKVFNELDNYRNYVCILYVVRNYVIGFEHRI